MIRVTISGRSRAVVQRLRELLDADDVIVVGESDMRAGPADDVDAVVGEVEAADESDSVVEEHLTPRELEVLRALGRGLSNRAIAERLGISEHTVKFHAATIYGKLGVSSRTEALREGLRRGLVEL